MSDTNKEPVAWRISRAGYTNVVWTRNDAGRAKADGAQVTALYEAPHPETPAPLRGETLTERLQQQCSDWGAYWRASDAHGVQLTSAQAVELLQTALGVEVEIAAPVPQSAGVTDEQLDAIFFEWNSHCYGDPVQSHRRFARAVLALAPGLSGWQEIAWKTTHKAVCVPITESAEVAEQWRAHGWPVIAFYAPAPGLAPHQPQPEGDYQRGWKDGNDTANKAHEALAREPMFWVRLLRDGLYEGPVHHKSEEGRMLREAKPDEWRPLYLAQPQPEPQEAAELEAEAHAEGFDSLSDYVANLKTSVASYMAERNSARDAYRRHRDESEARGKLINIVLGLVDAPAGANVVQAVAAALSAPQEASKPEPIAPGVSIDFKQATDLLDMFGGEPTEITLMTVNGHSGPGLYAVYNADPEGAVYLGETDEEAEPSKEASKAVPVADEREAFDPIKRAISVFEDVLNDIADWEDQALAEAVTEAKDALALYLRPSQQALSDEAAGEFADWLCREMPPGTVISDPAWWAPKIMRAILAAAGGSQ